MPDCVRMFSVPVTVLVVSSSRALPYLACTCLCWLCLFLQTLVAPSDSSNVYEKLLEICGSQRVTPVVSVSNWEHTLTACPHPTQFP
jgi:hypothetical protein